MSWLIVINRSFQQTTSGFCCALNMLQKFWASEWLFCPRGRLGRVKGQPTVPLLSSCMKCASSMPSRLDVGAASCWLTHDMSWVLGPERRCNRLWRTWIQPGETSDTWFYNDRLHNKDNNQHFILSLFIWLDGPLTKNRQKKKIMEKRFLAEVEENIC